MACAVWGPLTQSSLQHLQHPRSALTQTRRHPVANASLYPPPHATRRRSVPVLQRGRLHNGVNRFRTTVRPHSFPCPSSAHHNSNAAADPDHHASPPNPPPEELPPVDMLGEDAGDVRPLPSLSPSLPSHPRREVLPPAHYNAIIFLASFGVLETAYLTIQKLTGGAVSCQMGGSCGSVLDSPWGTLGGLPLSLYGCCAYVAAAVLAHLAKSPPPRSLPAKWLLLATTSVMTAVSAYLLYILNTELHSVFCLYCFVSAALSLTLMILTYQGLTEQEVKLALLPQAGVATAVLLGLSVAFGDVSSPLIDLPPIPPEVTTFSPPPVVALARHLQSVGARMYGAFWCSHCFEQKEVFGREAMEYVGYVECYPDGYRNGVKIAHECEEANITGFPTWIVKGKVLSGEQGLDELAIASGFDLHSIRSE